MQKLAEICVRRPVFATMLVMALTVVGAASTLQARGRSYPRIETPVVSVSTSNPGAAPESIETEVTDESRKRSTPSPASTSCARRSARACRASHHVRAREEPRHRRSGSARQGRSRSSGTCPRRRPAGRAEAGSRRRAGDHSSFRSLRRCLARADEARREERSRSASERSVASARSRSSATRTPRDPGLASIPTGCMPTTSRSTDVATALRRPEHRITRRSRSTKGRESCRSARVGRLTDPQGVRAISSSRPTDAPIGSATSARRGHGPKSRARSRTLNGSPGRRRSRSEADPAEYGRDGRGDPSAKARVKNAVPRRRRPVTYARPVEVHQRVASRHQGAPVLGGFFAATSCSSSCGTSGRP